MKTLLIIFFTLLSTTPFAAVDVHEFAQADQQQAYQSLITELRCLVCQNQTIADSNADLAKDLRQQVYEMIQKGQSKQQIIDFMTDRYGDFVLYKPAFNGKTLLLWLGPGLFLVVGLITVFMISRRYKAKASPQILSDEQHARLVALLEAGDDE